ncbi:hypothetical protein [Arthrobacter sp. CP30]
MSAEPESLSTEVVQPALQNVAGRSGAAVGAVNEVATILTTADIDRTTAANQALVRTEQAKVDGLPDGGGSAAPASRTIPRWGRRPPRVGPQRPRPFSVRVDPDGSPTPPGQVSHDDRHRRVRRGAS